MISRSGTPYAKAPCLHRDSQVVCPAKGGNKQGYQDRDEALHAHHEAAFPDPGPSRDLSTYDAFGFLENRRHKPHGDAHDKSNFSGRHTDMAKGLQQIRYSIGQLYGGSTRGEQNAHECQQDQPAENETGQSQSLARDSNKPELPDRRAGVKNICTTTVSTMRNRMGLRPRAKKRRGIPETPMPTTKRRTMGIYCTVFVATKTPIIRAIVETSSTRAPDRCTTEVPG